MIPYSKQSIDESDIAAVSAVLKSSHLTQGKEVEAFEEALCAYVGVKYAITFNAATSALLAAYMAAGIGEGDEIITTPISFVATANMAVVLGAKPIWCDVKLDGNIDERFITKLITPKTKAIVPVDFGGKPVNIDAINKIASQHNLLVIEDACHALGSEIEGKKVGSFSDMSIFSFHAIKPITTAEGGAVLTNDEALADKLRLIRSHGITKKRFWDSDMSMMGYNFRLSDIQAALGRSQLKRLDMFVQKRNEIAAFYDETFANHRLFNTVTIAPNERSSRLLYPIVLIPQLQCPKEDIFSELINQGIGVQVHYKPIYKNSFYVKKFGEHALHVADDFYRSELSIPCHQEMTLEDARFVAKALLEAVEKYRHRGCSF